MDTPNSSENGLSSDFEGKDVQTQAEGTENSLREGDYAKNGLCPECLNPVETHCYDVLDGGIETGLTECFDFCPVCWWEGYPYYE